MVTAGWYGGWYCGWYGGWYGGWDKIHYNSIKLPRNINVTPWLTAHILISFFRNLEISNQSLQLIAIIYVGSKFFCDEIDKSFAKQGRTLFFLARIIALFGEGAVTCLLDWQGTSFV